MKNTVAREVGKSAGVYLGQLGYQSYFTRKKKNRVTQGEAPKLVPSVFSDLKVEKTLDLKLRAIKENLKRRLSPDCSLH